MNDFKSCPLLSFYMNDVRRGRDREGAMKSILSLRVRSVGESVGLFIFLVRTEVAQHLSDGLSSNFLPR